jgi:hypothetical protein
MKHIAYALVGTLLLALTSCAVTEPPRYTTDHPANPLAPAAAVEPPSALNSYRSFAGTGPSQPPSPEQGHAHHH